MKVIRVEHEDGWGMFRRKVWTRTSVSDSTDPVLQALWENHSAYNENGMPVPQDDGINMRKDLEDWFCAFDPIQFTKWVSPDEVKVLKEHGFRVLLLDVECYQLGKHQVAFTKESITLSLDITDFVIGMFCGMFY